MFLRIMKKVMKCKGFQLYQQQLDKEKGKEEKERKNGKKKKIEKYKKNKENDDKTS